MIANIDRMNEGDVTIGIAEMLNRPKNMCRCTF